jgi:hypothetical protein
MRCAHRKTATKVRDGKVRRSPAPAGPSRRVEVLL